MVIKMAACQVLFARWASMPNIIGASRPPPVKTTKLRRCNQRRRSAQNSDKGRERHGPGAIFSAREPILRAGRLTIRHAGLMPQ